MSHPMTNLNETQSSNGSTPGAGLAALVRYQPTWLTGDDWRVWRPRVVALAGDSHPDNASLARLSAGVLCEVIALTNPAADAAWSDVVSDRSIRVVVADRRRRGRSAKHTDRGLSELRRLQRLVLDCVPSTRTGRPVTAHRTQLSELTVLAGGDDAVLASQARRILAAVAVVRPDPWISPLSGAEWKEFDRGARAAGVSSARWRWRDLKAERVRYEFNRARPVVEVLREWCPSGKRLDGIAGVGVRHFADSYAKNASKVRGVCDQSQSVTWRIGAVEAQMTTVPVSTTKSPKRRKVSAAAVRRARAELLARRTQEPPHLPQDLEVILRSWSPQVISSTQWIASRPLATQILRRSEVRGKEKFAKAMRVVAHFVTWAREAGYEEDEERLLSARVIDDYVARAIVGSNESSRATARSILRSIASHAQLSSDAPVKSTPIAHWEIAPPYRLDEIDAFRRRIDLITNAPIRRRTETAFALGIGAGLEARDIRDLTRAHVDDLALDGIRITVLGGRPRAVWLRREFEDLLRSGISHLTANEHILGRPNAGKDVLVDLYDHVRSLRGNDKVQQRRLRNTWIATLMCEPIPLWTLMSAAGLVSARSISDLAQFLEPVEDTTVVRGVA